MSQKATAVGAWESLFRAQVAVMRTLAHEFPTRELSFNEYDVMFNVSRQPGRSLRLRDLNKQLTSLTTEFSKRVLAESNDLAVHLVRPGERPPPPLRCGWPPHHRPGTRPGESALDPGRTRRGTPDRGEDRVAMAAKPRMETSRPLPIAFSLPARFERHAKARQVRPHVRRRLERIGR